MNLAKSKDAGFVSRLGSESAQLLWMIPSPVSTSLQKVKNIEEMQMNPGTEIFNPGIFHRLGIAQHRKPRR
jgi:hypothetical protein